MDLDDFAYTVGSLLLFLMLVVVASAMIAWAAHVLVAIDVWVWRRAPGSW